MGDNTHECTVGGNATNGCGLELEWKRPLENIRPEDLVCPNADAGCEGIMKPIDFSKSDGRLFDKAWGIAKEADWDTSFNFKEDRKKATWSQEDIDRLNARNDKAREALKNRTPLPTKGNENALNRALSRARRENAKPKPKLRITRPEDWE